MTDRRLFSETERKALRGEVEKSRQLRQRIRERVRGGIVDFALLFEYMDERDLRQIFQGDPLTPEEFVPEEGIPIPRSEGDPKGPGLNPELKDDLQDMLAFIFRGALTAYADEDIKHLTEEAFIQACQQARPENVVEDITLNVEAPLRELVLENAYAKLEQGDQLTETEKRVLSKSDPNAAEAIARYLDRVGRISSEELVQYIREYPNLIEEGFDPLGEEFKTQSGMIADLVGRDQDDQIVVVEVKTSDRLDLPQAKAQMEQLLNEFGGVERTRGILITHESSVDGTEELEDLPFEIRFIHELGEDVEDSDHLPPLSPRHVKTVEFQLTPAEQDLYNAVTDYVENHIDKIEENHSTRFAFMVMLRRLRSSSYAILQTLKRRKERLEDMLNIPYIIEQELGYKEGEESPEIELENQVQVVHEILNSYDHQYLVGDEVGLKNTSETGNIIEGLIESGHAERVLIVTSAQLTVRWQEKMREKFDLDFTICDYDTVQHYRQSHPNQNIWLHEDLIITSIDFAKQNDILETLQNLHSQWDITIFDEVHHLTPPQSNEDSTTRTQRYKLTEAIADKSNAFLLLTGEPPILVPAVKISEHSACANNIEAVEAEVEQLSEVIEKAERVHEMGPESKRVQMKEEILMNLGDEKLLVFTEFKDTLDYLTEELRDWGYDVVHIHGGMDVDARSKAEDEFRNESQILVATDAASEGANLQFCRWIVNYDIPWDPTRLEERIDRIHQTGHKEEVYIFNMIPEDVLEGKILHRLSDKGDSAQGTHRSLDQ